MEGWSKNKRYYPAEELSKLHGKQVPLLWMHEGTPQEAGDTIPEDKIIGHCTVYWKGSYLLYVGKVKEEFSWCVSLAKGASIGAHFKQDLLFVTDIHLEEVSLVLDAGIPAATVSQTDLASLIKLNCHLGRAKTSIGS